MLNEKKNIAPESRFVCLVLEEPGSGGTEVYVEGLATYLSQYKEVVILTLSNEVVATRERFPEFNTESVDGIAGLKSYLRHHPNLILNLHLYTSLWGSVRMARQTGHRAITTLHQPLAAWNLLHQLFWILAVFFSDQVIGVSNACLQSYVLVKHKKRLHKIPAPLQKWPIVRPEKKAHKDAEFKILFVGRLSKEKDIETLIHAISKTQNVKLEIIGTGPLHQDLLELAKSLNVPVEFHGALLHEKVFERFNEVDAFVLPSRFEGLGIAAVEAMAFFTPTITSDFPASKEYIIEGETGLSFPIGDFTALAEKINMLKNSVELQKKLSVNGARHAKKLFSPSTLYSRYYAVLGQ